MTDEARALEQTVEPRTAMTRLRLRIREVYDAGRLNYEAYEEMDKLAEAAAVPATPDDRGHVHRHPTGSPFDHDECDLTDRAVAAPLLDRLTFLRGTLALIASGRGPATAMASAALDADDARLSQPSPDEPRES